MKKKKIIGLVISLIILSLITINLFNLNQIKPDEEEISYFDKLFPNINVKNIKDLIKVQNICIENIKHELLNDSKELNTIECIKLRKGLCYDRSLLLQKYFISKGFKIRPVFLYESKNLMGIFNKNLNSHNIFEVKIEDQWYAVGTNKKALAFYDLETFVQKKYPNFQYIRYLNNRNGKFIWPNVIPDIYGNF